MGSEGVRGCRDGRRRVWLRIDGLDCHRWVLELGGASEPAFERVSRAIGEQCRHARGGESRHRLLGIIPICIFGIAVDALSLSLPPADAPRRMTRRRGDREDVTDVSLRCAQRPFQHCHAAHRATDRDRDRRYSEVIKHELMQPSEPRVVIKPSGRGANRQEVAHLTSSRIVVAGNSGP